MEELTQVAVRALVKKCLTRLHGTESTKRHVLGKLQEFVLLEHCVRKGFGLKNVCTEEYVNEVREFVRHYAETGK